MAEQPFFVGSYTRPTPETGAPDGHGAGIAHGVLDTATGSLAFVDAVLADNPSFIAGVDGGRLWATSEAADAGTLASYRVDRGQAPVLTRSVETGTSWPCHVEIDAARRLAYVSHFHGGMVSVVSLDEEGSPARLVQRFELPRVARGVDRDGVSRPHCVRRLGDGLLLATDCGRDLVLLYRVHGEGGEGRLVLMDAFPLAPGTGPRHVTFVEGANTVYVSNQTDPGVSVLSVDRQSMRLGLVDTVASPGLGRAKTFPSEIVAHPRRDRVYLANRRDESISVYEVVADTGSLRLRSTVDVHGVWPRHLRLSPGERFALVANQNSNEVVAFHVDDDGDLEWTGRRLAIATPTCIVFG